MIPSQNTKSPHFILTFICINSYYNTSSNNDDDDDEDDDDVEHPIL